MIRFGGPDKVSIRLLAEWPNGLLFSPGAADLTKEKIEEHFTNGSSVFHGGDLIEKYYVGRVRNYAHIGTLEQARIRKARVVATLPSACKVHDGRIIDVVNVASWIKWFRTLQPEEYAKRVFGKDYGFPPFGIGCDCRLEGVIPGVDDADV